MIISTQPLFLPLNTANLPTEAVGRDNRLAERIPQPRQVLEEPAVRALAPEREPVSPEQAAPPAGEKPTETAPPEATETGEAAENREQTEDNPQERRRQQQELAQLSELKVRDREVRNHERAHVVVGGQYAGAPTYTYTRGPNGQLYATGGEVPIDTAPVPGNPAATLAKAEQVRRAALAPKDPSAVDRRIAAEAASQASQARAELAQVAAEARAQKPESEGGKSGHRLSGRLRELGITESPDAGARVDLSA